MASEKNPTANGNAPDLSAQYPFRPLCNGGKVWALLWPRLRAGKAVTLEDVTKAFSKAVPEGNGNVQSSSERAKQFLPICVKLDKLAHAEPGTYVLSPTLVAIYERTKAAKTTKKATAERIGEQEQEQEQSAA